VPRCPNLAGRCPTHPARGQGRSQGWATAHGQNVHRLRGHRLDQARKALHARTPWCALCRRVLALRDSIRDHIVPLAEGGAEVEANTQILCRPCSQTKTAAEARRGAARSR
jgi:5-methylcytosine-specific restriction enzyme A